MRFGVSDRAESFPDDAYDRCEDDLLRAAEESVDPPSTCDSCMTVVEHASDLYEVETDRWVCADCAGEKVVDLGMEAA